jgi:chromosome segregation ATPase
MKINNFDLFSLKNIFTGSLLLVALLFLSNAFATTLEIPAWVAFFTITPAVLVASYILQIKKFSQEKAIMQKHEELKKQINQYDAVVKQQEGYLDAAEVLVKELRETIDSYVRSNLDLQDKINEQDGILQSIRDDQKKIIENHEQNIKEFELALKRESEKLKESMKLLTAAQETIDDLSKNESKIIILQEKVRNYEKELGRAAEHNILWQDEPEDTKGLLEFLEKKKAHAISITNGLNPVIGKLKKLLND